MADVIDLPTAAKDAIGPQPHRGGAYPKGVVPGYKLTVRRKYRGTSVPAAIDKMARERQSPEKTPAAPPAAANAAASAEPLSAEKMAQETANMMAYALGVHLMGMRKMGWAAGKSAGYSIRHLLRANEEWLAASDE